MMFDSLYENTQYDNLFEEKSSSFDIPYYGGLSLMRQPLQCPAEVVLQATKQNEQQQQHCESFPQSFQEPFDDPDMEPVPIGAFRSEENDLSQLSSSILALEGNFESMEEPSFLSPLSSSFFTSTDETVGSKDSNDDVFSSTSTLCSYMKQKQSSSSVSSDDTMVRFRPYQDRKWRGMFEKLVQYKHKHGHCCVPHSYKEDKMLARWVKRQRYQHKKFEDNDPASTMTAQRIDYLNSIGFVWHSHASAWQTKLNELKTFKHKTGHCDVPSHYPENVPLSAWVRCQRRQYTLWKSGSSTSTMTSQRFEQLQSLGFTFEKSTREKVENI
ncbi:unnamed protein product [Cylindrotheca closterium]|uniref:Helicase-associated domain-containing protein n=1 Tax=Cylindrotheca closterium TaxID=2856 RepID=A0AAD2G754_9STRA|nr:unnamed protein product [Cylindrotheca closterium]